MKKAVWVLALAVILAGCSAVKSEMDRAMELRTQLLKSQGCTFDAAITADYGDKLYTFSMNCKSDPKGNLEFTVVEPKSIAGISGAISEGTGKLTFDSTVLEFPLLADGLLTPVSAPWVFARTLLSGYLTSAGTEGENLRLSVDDSFRDDALRLDIWLDSENIPIRSEILHGGRKILSLNVTNFAIL